MLCVWTDLWKGEGGEGSKIIQKHPEGLLTLYIVKQMVAVSRSRSTGQMVWLILPPPRARVILLVGMCNIYFLHSAILLKIKYVL